MSNYQVFESPKGIDEFHILAYNSHFITYTPLDPINSSSSGNELALLPF